VFGRHSSWTFPLFVFNGTAYFVHVSAAVFLLLYLGSVQDAYQSTSFELLTLASGVVLAVLAHELFHQKALWLIDETVLGRFVRRIALAVVGKRLPLDLQAGSEPGDKLVPVDFTEAGSALEAVSAEADAERLQAEALRAVEFRADVHTVTIFPFGGVSEVSGRSTQWAVIGSAFAAPVGSFLLAFLFGLAFDGTIFPSAMVDVISGEHKEFSLMLELARVNWFIGVVNLVPLLPFDGGLLLLTMRRLSASGRAAGEDIAQRFSTWSIVGCGAGIAIAWVSYNSMLLMVLFASALMVGLRLGLLAQAYGAAGSLKASDAMIGIDRLTVLPHGTRLTSALRQALKSFQSVFPIVKGSELMGMVERDDLLKATQRSEGYVAEFVRGDIVSVRPNVPLKEVVALFESVGLNYLPVIEESQFRGIIVKDRLFEFLLVRGMEEMRQRMPSDEDWFEM
jgi:CBS domain-containing protein